MGLTSVLCIDVKFLYSGVLMGFLRVEQQLSLAIWSAFGTPPTGLPHPALIREDVPRLTVTWYVKLG